MGRQSSSRKKINKSNHAQLSIATFQFEIYLFILNFRERNNVVRADLCLVFFMTFNLFFATKKRRKKNNTRRDRLQSSLIFFCRRRRRRNRRLDRLFGFSFAVLLVRIFFVFIPKFHTQILP